MPGWHRRIDAGSSLVGDGYRTRSHQTGGRRTQGDHYQKVIITVGELAHAVTAGARSQVQWQAPCGRDLRNDQLPPQSSPPPESGSLSWALVVSVVVTLLVISLAEEYAELLGEQLEAG